MMIQFKPSPRVITAALTLALFIQCSFRAAQGLSDVGGGSPNTSTHAEAVALLGQIVNINSG